MGLLLSVLVVCVGVLEAISCVRHVQHGYLHSWAAARLRPMMHDHPRGKPKVELDGYSSDESSDELSRILHNGGGVNVNRDGSATYRLTPILTEHRRNSPILQDESKCNANNIDESYRDDDEATEHFRPISPSDLEEPLDESYVSPSGKFLQVPPDDSPLQRSSSEETLHDSECEDGGASCPVEETEIGFQIDAAEGADVEMSDDPVFNLVSAAAYILRTEGPVRRSPPGLGVTVSSCRPLNVDITARIPTPQTHRESIPFDLVAAHVTSSTSRPETPTTPRKSRADISWPVFHPEPVIKRPVIDLTRGASIEEDELMDASPRLEPECDLEDPCSKVVARSLTVTPCVTVPGGGARVGAQKNPDPPPCVTSPVDRFGRITGEPQQKRRGSLEGLEGSLKDSVMSKSLPDFFFEENAAKKVDDTEDNPAVSLGKDITPKESSIKRRRSYREKKRSNWSSSRSRGSDVTEPVSESDTDKPKKSLFEIDNESIEDFVGPVETEVVGKVEAIINSMLTPVEVLHHAEVMPQSGVFATSTQQQKTRLKKPAKAESFEEVGPESSVFATPSKKHVEEVEPECSVLDTPSKKQVDVWPESSVLVTPTNKLVEEAGPKSSDLATPSEKQVEELRPESSILNTTTNKQNENAEPKTSVHATPNEKQVEKAGPEGIVLATPSKPKEEPEFSVVATHIEKQVEEAVPESPTFAMPNEKQVEKAGPESIVLATPCKPEEEPEISVVATHIEKQVEKAVPESPTLAMPNEKQGEKAGPERIVLATPSKEQVEEVGLESSVVATPTSRQVDRPGLDTTVVATPTKTPVKEEAGPESTVITTPTKKPLEAGPTGGGRHLSDEMTPQNATNASVEQDPPQVECGVSRACAAASTPDETNENDDQDAEDEDLTGIESDTSNVNQPHESTEAAPFWLIFSGEYTKAMSKDWHSGHFCCWQCDESLTGQRYVLRDDHPYCIKCYESVFANMCEECSKTIGIDSKDLSYKDKHWHEACFLCNKCRVSLVDKQFGSKADKIYCSNCYDAQFASRCDGCGEIFRAGTKKMEYKTRQWHEKCFCCCVCKSAIGTKSFIPREQEIYCATCYEEKFATRCVKCNKIITSGGVTYKNEPWHRECFTCTHCNTSLAGQRFTSRDEKPYCAECFGELFAKRCTACVKPITGIGGTRFISFEDRHWHNDCFICASCKTSLVGRGFITDAEDIICPECAKQKLM